MEQELMIRNGETERQYFYRLCNMKDKLGFTWPEIAEVMNETFGYNYGESKYRKEWASFKHVFTANEDKFVGEDKYLEQIRAEKYELEKERQKLYATKIEANRSLRQESRAELFYENIRDAIEHLPMPEIAVDDSMYMFGRSKEHLLCIADIQAGANFEIDINKYSLKICEERFNLLLNYAVEYVLNHVIYKLHVVELGDSIQNILRLTDLKLNETSVVEATVTVARLIACFLNKLSAYCNIEYYHVPMSNHANNRLIGSKANELVYEDMEYVIGNYIHDMLIDNDRVSVHLNYGHDYIEIPIFNFNIMAMHGHTIKNLDTALRDLSAKHRRFVDYVIIGHYHEGKIVPGNAHGSHDTELLMCPSFQGADPYGYEKLGLSSKAACKIFVFDAIYGCTGIEKFILN